MEEIKKILYEGTKEEKRYLFTFDIDIDSSEKIEKKFNLFARYSFPKFFKSKTPEFHHEMIRRLVKLYKGEDYDEFLNIGFKGCSKTTMTKLFLVFILCNDIKRTKKYIKVLSSDLKNSRQIVTDTYNMLISQRVAELYPELFEKTDNKRQETMEIIDLATGVKVTAGTVGQTQRGNVQGYEEAARPDILLFDDIETSKTLRSAVETNAIWSSMQEAITGLALKGITIYLANYISESGNVHKLVTRVKNKMITPIIDDNGNPLWDIYTPEIISNLKKKTDNWEGEYLCKPSASKDVYIARESFDNMKPSLPIRTVGGAKIFKEYIASHRYGGGADVAGGLGLDSSASVIIDFSTVPANVVLTYNSNTILPEAFGSELYNQSNMYGGCIFAPENNKYDTATFKYKDLGGNVFMQQKNVIKVIEAKPTTYGWNTNSLTKNKMLSELKEAIESGLINLNDEDLINEAKMYTRNDVLDNPSDVRLVTRHFDLFTALAIAWQMIHESRPQKTKVNHLLEQFNRIDYSSLDIAE